MCGCAQRGPSGCYLTENPLGFSVPICIPHLPKASSNFFLVILREILAISSFDVPLFPFIFRNRDFSSMASSSTSSATAVADAIANDQAAGAAATHPCFGLAVGGAAPSPPLKGKWVNFLSIFSFKHIYNVMVGRVTLAHNPLR